MNNEKELRHRYGWTPAATKAPYSQTNVNLEYKGRDYDAILRAAKRKPVGYWEDAPIGIKFGGGGTAEKRGEIKPPEGPRAAPTTPLQSTDGPWPKWYKLDMARGWKNQTYYRYTGPTSGEWFNPPHNAIGEARGRCIRSPQQNMAIPCSEPEALQWLEQNGHKDAAAQLRGKGDDVATVRVTISTAPRAEVDCKTRRELKQTHVKIEMATGLIIPCDETDPDKIGYVR